MSNLVRLKTCIVTPKNNISFSPNYRQKEKKVVFNLNTLAYKNVTYMLSTVTFVTVLISV